VSGTVQGVQLEPSASRKLRELEKSRRERVAHVLEEMVAVVQITWPAIQPSVQEGERLHFTAAGVRVEYSIDDRTGLLTVHQISQGHVALAG
jgi:mRNA-degrading endonuclease RelE of RelBE toxin-antitoxin system